MTTDQLLSIQPALAGLNLGAAGAASPQGAPADGSEAFLRALMDKIKGLSPEVAAAVEAVPAAQEGAAAPMPMADFKAFIEQIKVLAGQTAVTQASQGGKEEDVDGNLLPVQATAEAELLPLTTAQLEQLVSQLLGRTAAPVQAQAEAAEAEARPITPPGPQPLLAVAGTMPSEGQAMPHEDPEPSESSSREKASAAAAEAQVAVAGWPVQTQTQPSVMPALAEPAAAEVASARMPPGISQAITSGTPANKAPQAVQNTAPAPPSESQASGTVSADGTQDAPKAAVMPLTAPGAPLLSEIAVPMSASPVTTALTSALNGGSQLPLPSSLPAAKPVAAVANEMTEMGEIALTPELLKLVAAKIGKAGEGEVESVAPTFASQSQSTRLGATAPDGSDLTLISQSPPPDIRAVAHPIQTGAPAMTTPFGRPDWSEDFGERVVWMTGKGIQSAELQLNPEHLGPVEVRINLNQDQASVQFVAHNAAVREAIEAAIPKLREMLGNQQLNLTDVSVAQQSFSDPRDSRSAQQAYDQQSRSAGQGGFKQGGLMEEAVQSEGEALVSRQTGRGLLNLYA